MAQPFITIDLSPASRDFQPVALEPGMPMIDRLKSHYKTLRTWVGDFAAEPELSKDGHSVEFLIPFRVPAAGAEAKAAERPVVTSCVPATIKDLKGPLRKELEELRRLAAQATPKGSTEQSLRRAVDRARQTQLDPENVQAGCHLFKYRDPEGRWRLVWCWGYQRRDDAPGVPTVHAGWLYVLRPGERISDILAARGTTQEGPPPRRRRRAGMWAALAALLLIAALGTAWFAFPVLRNKLASRLGVAHRPPGVERLVVTPETWSGPVGGRVQFTVNHVDAAGKSEDVTLKTAGASEDPTVFAFRPNSLVATASAPGRTAVRFSLGKLSSQATVSVEPPRNPNKVAIEPADVELGIGSTAQLKLIGEFEGGNKVDLTDRAEWNLKGEGTVFCYRGLLEGLADGGETIQARYRSSPQSPFVETSAKVRVAGKDYKSLELAVRPQPLAVDQAGEIDASALTSGGQKRPIVQSSLLRLEVDPASLASVQGGKLVAKSAGKGTLKATFRDLNATASIEVVAKPAGESPPAELAVLPKQLDMVVGEVTRLTVTGAAEGPVEVVSSDPAIVDVADQTLTARTTGEVKIEVKQGEHKAEAAVKVAEALFQALAIEPDRIPLKVNDTAKIKVVGQVKGDRRAELAADLLTWERLPEPDDADFDPHTLTLRGRSAAGGAPQTIAVRYGDLHATAKVELIAAPFTLEATPAGPLSLPVGQSARLQAWANYGDGRRVELLGSGLEWKAESVSGLKLAGDGTVTAERPDVGPLTVHAVYQGKDSNEVSIKSVAAAAVTLALSAPRAVLLVGETGRLTLTASDEKGPVDLGEAGVKFASSDEKLLTVDASTGAFRAVGAGAATVTAAHPGAKDPAKLELKIADPAQARLVFEPAQVVLTVGTQAELKLSLATKEGEQEKLAPLEAGADVSYTVASPDAVSWKPPVIAGVSPAPEFPLTAMYQGLSATARVTVAAPAVAEGKGGPIRVVPDQASLAVGQAVAPRVEQQVPGSKDEWREVLPTAVHWSVPDGVLATRATDTLRPTFALLPNASAEVPVVADYQGQHATLKLAARTDRPAIDRNDPAARLVLVREPPGVAVRVGESQRYAIEMRKNRASEPVADVRWPANFENEYVRWEAPVLTAKRRGHMERLEAMVGTRRVPFMALTVGEPPTELTMRRSRRFASPSEVEESGPAPPVPAGAPTEVAIAPVEGTTLAIPVGVSSRAFRVTARFSQTEVDVTRLAALLVEGDPAAAPVAVQNRGLVGVRPGSALVQARFRGTSSAQGMKVDVAGDLAIDAIRLVPNRVSLGAGESVPLRAIGLRQGRVLGDITGRSELAWKSRNPEVIGVAGPSLTALKPGQGGVTVQLGTTVSNVAEVVVRPATSIARDPIRVTPESIAMRVGESRQLGSDLRILRGEGDFSRQARVTVVPETVASFHEDSGLLLADAPGQARVVFTYGGQFTTLHLAVQPAAAPSASDTIVIEPAGGDLGVGEARPLRLYLVNADGERVDRSGSAVLTSTDPAVEASGTTIRGIKPGTATISARVPGVREAGSARFTVSDSALTQLAVTPSRVALRVGQRSRVLITGISPTRRIDLSEHPDLKAKIEGPAPAPAELIGANELIGRAPGSATLHLTWREKVEASVPIEVTAASWTGLTIEPVDATIKRGESIGFAVFGRQADQLVPLTAKDGVDLRVGQASVAAPTEGFQLKGIAPGTTAVVAELGNRRATARLTVLEGPATPTTPGKVVGLRFRSNLVRMSLGFPGMVVNVLNVKDSGDSDDVSSAVKLTVNGPEDVVSIGQTPSGLILKPLKAGQTQISASLESWTTARPLLVEVTAAVPNSARLLVSPDPLTIRIGQTGTFRRVEVLAAPGESPVEVPYKIEVGNAPNVELAGTALRGLKEGRAEVKVVAVMPGSPVDSLSAPCTVEIVPGITKGQEGLDLVLSGPNRATVGSDVSYHVELASSDLAQDVTNDATSLLLEQGSTVRAEVRPGCVLHTVQPGTVTVQAQRSGIVSNRIELTIAPVATSFRKLVLDIDRRPITVGESRTFRLTGDPAGGGPPQDLTGQLTDSTDDPARPLLRFEPEGVADRQGGALVGKKPGAVTVRAKLGETLESETVSLQVVAAAEVAGLTVQPDSCTIRVGERTPHITTQARGTNDATARRVAAELKSLDESILAPDPRAPGTFLGRKAGRTRLQAAYGGQTAELAVTVIPNRFETVRVLGGPHKQEDRFDLDVEVLAPRGEGRLEYRIPAEGAPADQGWVAAQPDGDQLRVQLRSPKFQLRPAALYRLVIESRDPADGSVETYHYLFRVIEGEFRIEPAKGQASAPETEPVDDSLAAAELTLDPGQQPKPVPEPANRSQAPPREPEAPGFGETRFAEPTETVQGVEVRVGDPQFTLIWDSPADIDLHVEEPGGSHIYWASRRGSQGGELDVDDIDGYGPENIYWTSAQGSHGPPGVYRWLVHYYAGNAGFAPPTRWKVRLKHDGKTTIYQGRLNGIGDRSKIYSFPFHAADAPKRATRQRRRGR